MDELARKGVQFTNAVSQSSWTRPAVASLLTGLYPSQHGVVEVGQSKNGRLSGCALDPAIPTLAELLAAGGWATAAFLGGNANLKPAFGLTRSFEHLRWQPTNDGAILARDFEEWLKAKKPEPAFCYLHFMDVHHPLPAEIISSRLDRGLDLQAVAESMNQLLEHYAASVRRVDQHIGRVVRALASAEILDGSWVILTADHGEELMDHGAMLAHGRTLYRELVHVPLLLRLPGRFQAGTIVDGPVELVDLVPTVLDGLGLPSPSVPGRSLMPRIGATETSAPAPAYSELVRRDRYAQSITTETYQFIRTFVFEEVPIVSPTDLREGMSVEVRGQPVQGRSFFATKVSLKPAGTVGKVRGTVEHVDVVGGSLTIMGLPFDVDEDTEFLGQDETPFALADLLAGERVSLAFASRPDGRRVAVKVKRTKPGGKSKIVGAIEQVQHLEGGLRSITILGIDVVLDGNMRLVTPLREKRDASEAEASALSRVLAAGALDTRRELYDIRVDPAQTRDICDERPDVANELEQLLMNWAESLAGTAHAPASAEIDPETLDQLRRMGYID